MRRMLVGITLAFLAAACTSGGAPSPPRASDGDPSPRTVYVAIGASETAGVGTQDPFRQAWPRVFWRTALPAGTVFYNFGIPGATVQQALTEELPFALKTRPTIATVWLNANDLIAGVRPAAYGRQLFELVSALRRHGRTQVLIANTPELDTLPAYLECRDGVSSATSCPSGGVPEPARVTAAVERYNQVIGGVASRTGAVVVDLHAFGDVPDEHPDWISSDGFHPSALGYQHVAMAVAKAMRAA